MPDRKDLDRPATVILTAFGIVFMAASIPFLPGLYCLSQSHNPDLCDKLPATAVVYDVAWTRVAIGSPQATTLTTAPGDATATITVSDQIVGDIHVKMAGPSECTDTYNRNTQSPATMTWTLKFDGTTIKEPTTFTCGAPFDETVTRHAEPEVAAVRALNDTDAATQVHNATKAQRETGSYTLTIHADRQPGTVPDLPPANPAATISIKMTIVADGFASAANLHKMEASK
ncbi:MAG: hypothetical protein V4510_00840 [bacterium]